MLDGVGKGFAGFGKSLWGGISGIVAQPIKGAKEEGLAGFGKGVGKGLLGTVVKPISGVVDLVSKTTEGIESSVDGNDCKANNVKMRLPRAFYKDAGVFKEYSPTNAKIYETLRSTIKEPVQRYASLTDAYYGAFKLGEVASGEEEMDSPMLMLSSNYLVVLGPDMSTQYAINTCNLMLPTKAQPNPILLPQ